MITNPSQCSARTPRITINSGNNNFESTIGSEPIFIPPYIPQVNPTLATPGTQPYWPPYANPFAYGNFMSKRFEGFVDFTKSGLSFGEKFTYKLYEKFSKWSRKWFTHIFLFLVVALYCVGGALVFVAVEGRQAQMNIVDVQAIQNDFFKAMQSLAKDDETLRYRSDEFNGQLVYTLRKHRLAIKMFLNTDQPVGEIQNPKNPWTFWNAMFFCGTIFTTIGYGHLTPQTTLGRSITIVYAIIGIPIFLILLADFGKLFTRCMKFLWAYVRRLYYTGTCRQVRKQQQIRDVVDGFNSMYDMAIRRPSMLFAGSDIEANSSGPKLQAQQTPQFIGSQGSQKTSGPGTPTTPFPETFEVDDEFNLPISLATTLLISYILIGALVYTRWEDWSYFEAFYFVFISMSTIGFGDLVPNHPIFMMCSIIYMVFGLALTSMFINVVQIKLSNTFKQASTKIGATIGLGLAVEGTGENSDGRRTKTPSDIASVHNPLNNLIMKPNSSGEEHENVEKCETVAPPEILSRQENIETTPVEKEKERKRKFFK